MKIGKGDTEMSKRRKRHSPEQIVKKLRGADATLNVGKSLGEVLHVLLAAA